MMKFTIAAAATLMALSGCGKTTFSGQSQAKKNDKSSNAGASKPLDLTKSFPVQTPVSFNIADLSLTSMMGLADTSLPFHLSMNAAVPSIEGMADLQDLRDPHQTGQSSAKIKNIDTPFHFDLTVLPPDIKSAACSLTKPVIGDIKPEELWHWAGWTAPTAHEFTGLTKYFLTYSSPVAADLNNDGKTEIITTISTGMYYQPTYNPAKDPTNPTYVATNDPDCILAKSFPCKSGNTDGNVNQPVNGPLVVLAGATGAVLWNTYDDPSVNVGVAVSTTPAVIDLDGDGYGDIVFATALPVDQSIKVPTMKFQITALDYHTRKIKWTYQDPNFICASVCSVAVGDIDGDGKPEVVAGNVILNEKGQKKAYLSPAPSGTFAHTLAELDPASPGLELVAGGGMVYSSTGSLLFDTKCRGFSAVADLDHDSKPKLVCVGAGKVSVYSNKGDLVWQNNIPVGAAYYADRFGKVGGGAPNIGDFNGDGKLDIGVAAGDFYVVYKNDGKELWRQPTADNSSMSTGSTLFDFNGDGKVEVIYNDEVKLRIYDGATGSVLWETANPSGTLFEYPLIVNVDDDASAEIVVSSPTLGGVRVFKDPSHSWVSTRRVWNQYSYYPEAIADNLKSTVVNAAPNGFRINAPGAAKLEQLNAPNLTVMAPFYSDDTQANASSDISLSFYVYNRGAQDATKGYKVTVYGKDATTILGSIDLADTLPASQGKLIAVKLNKPLAADQLSLVVEVARNDAASLLCSAEVKQTKFDLKALKRP